MRKKLLRNSLYRVDKQLNDFYFTDLFPSFISPSCRATGPGILGYTLSETVLNPEDGSIYRVYLPDEGTILPSDPGDFLADPNANRVPMGGGGEVDGGGLMDPTPSVSTPSPGVNRIPGSFTTRTGSCSKSIPSIGDGLPENCIQGE